MARGVEVLALAADEGGVEVHDEDAFRVGLGLEEPGAVGVGGGAAAVVEGLVFRCDDAVAEWNGGGDVGRADDGGGAEDVGA